MANRVKKEKHARETGYVPGQDDGNVSGEVISAASEVTVGEDERDEAAAGQPSYFDYHDAMIQIEMLFQSHILSFGYKEYSLETYVDRRFFREWKAREGCADTDEMRAGLNIDGILRSADPSESEVLTYLQYTLNIAELCRRSFNREEAPGYDFDIRNYTELLSRIREILKRFRHEVKYVPEKEFIFLVPRDPAAEAASEDESDPVSAAITEYRSSSAKGQIGRKRELLSTLGSSIERFNDNLKRENNVLFSRIEFMLNNLNIREGGQENEQVAERVARMSSEEMEDWYDETYQMILLRILQHENQERIRKVDELAAECGTGINAITEEEMAQLLNADPGDADLGTAEFTGEAVSRLYRTEKVPAVPEKKSTSRGVLAAIVIADVLFVLFILCYFYFLRQ